MGKTVFILGAGASREAGAPLMADFLDKARQLLANGKVNDKDKKHFENVFEALVELRPTFFKSNIDLDNIESVFSAFEMARLINKLGDYSSDKIAELDDSIKTLIVRTLGESIIYHNKGGNLAPPFPYYNFSELVKSVNPSDYSIITFNYDVAVDCALHVEKVAYHLDQQGGNFGVIKLLKLHGSLNWWQCPKCNKVIPSKSWHPYLMGDRYFPVFEREKCDKCNCDLKTTPFIIPPTLSKGEHRNQLGSVWAQAAKELEEAENIFSIGYSLPESDLFFRYLFALGTVGKSHLQRFWVFEPEHKEEVEERFRKLIGRGIESRFEVKKEKFSKAIPIIGDELKR
jgi:hypothetical protein